MTGTTTTTTVRLNHARRQKLLKMAAYLGTQSNVFNQAIDLIWPTIEDQSERTWAIRQEEHARDLDTIHGQGED